MNDEDRRETVISSIVSLFSHEQANSLLTRTFSECSENDYKNDCMNKVMQAVKQDRDMFVLRLESIITLHSNVLKLNKDLFYKLNRILSIINLKYNNESGLIIAEHVPSVLLNKEEKFIHIETEFIPDTFYNNLIEQINVTYLDNCYSATKILIRKLFENLLIDILRKKYGTGEDVKLYWNTKYNTFLSFRKIIRNFSKKISEFQIYSKNIDEIFIDFIDKYVRYIGNESAHSIEDKITKVEIEKKKGQINDYVEILFSLFQKI